MRKYSRLTIAVVCCVFIVLAGCANTPPEQSPTASPSPSASPTVSATPSTSTPASSPAPCAVDSSVQAVSSGENTKPYPAFPDRLTEQSVENYSMAFEKALKWNLEAAAHNVTRIDWGFVETDVIDHYNGTWEVQMDVRAGVYYGPSGNHEDQAYLVTYVISNESVRRTATMSRDTPDAWNGPVVACP